MDALDGRAAEAADARQLCADAAEPFDRGGAVFAQRFDQLRIIDVLAANLRIQLHELHRVEIALGVFLISSPLLGNRGGQGGDGFAIGVIGSGGSERLFHACALAKRVFILQRGFRGVHAAGGAHGVAAGHGLAFYEDDVLAGFGSGDGGRHARAARAHDDHVARIGCILRLFLGGGDGLGVVSRIQPRSRQGSGSSSQDSIRSNGCTGDDVHGQRVILRDLRRQCFQRLVADAGRFVRAFRLAGDNDPILQGERDGNVASQPFRNAGEIAADAGGSGFSQSNRREHQARDENCGNAFEHKTASFVLKVTMHSQEDYTIPFGKDQR